jgi:glycosyltransferase involved in cell wall biosynthesis
MRIGFDVSATSNEKTGCTWYADSLIRAMVRDHRQHSYVLYHHFGRLCLEHAAKGTTLNADNVCQPFLDSSANDARHEWGEIERGRAPAGKPDIIQANFFDCPRIHGVPVVYVVYDFSFWMCPEFLTPGHLIGCTRGTCEAISNASGFIFISDHTHQEFERLFPGWLKRKQMPWRVIHLAARGRDADAVVEPVFGRDYWLFVGSMEPRKNLLTLLQAHDAYWERSPSPKKLLLAGGRGWCSNHIHQEIAVREKCGRVRYTGYVPEAQMEALYANAFAVVYPSYYEGFGLPILEAMDRGVPVVCSRATSHPEVGGDAVDYFDPWSPAELTERMLDLERDDKRRERLATDGKARAAQFSWQRVADETIRFYDDVIGSWKRKYTAPV